MQDENVSFDEIFDAFLYSNKLDVERTYEYDNAGRVTKVMCGGQIVESYTYGAKGRTVTVTDGNGKDYLYNYSEFGRLTSEKNRLGDIKQYFYDTDGALESQNNFDGTTSSIIYNTDRTERRVVYSDGHVNRFIYDAMGNIILAENEYGTTEYTYDRGGKLIKQSEKNGETVTFSYDASGNRIKLAGAGQETSYRYGKNNELLEVFDRLSRNGVTFSYDKAGKEIKRTLNNGNVQYRYYDKAGRIVLLKTEIRNRELLFAEGYVYGADGKRSAKVTSAGEVTLYEYDSQGRLSTVWNPATKDMEKLLTEEAEENGLPTLKELKENKYLSGSIQNELSALVYRMNSPARITPMQLFIKEQYSYDGNGNRITKTTAHGTIKYWYDEENRLLATGSNNTQNVKYTYDKNGNLLKKESKLKTTTYAYNSENRIVYSEVRDIMKKIRTVTNYAYDAFGRRLIVQDNGGTALRSVYDAFTFDVLKEAPTYENGLFTDTGSAGIKFGKTGKPTGERYRYLDDDHNDGNRYYYLEEGNWKNVSSRYVGTRDVLTANSEVVSQYKEESGSEYFIVDEFGSVKGTSDGYGNLNVTYSYDAFGTLVSDGNSVSYGYAGKSYDSATGLYNFGYRDYLPTAARFTTSDPIHDGENWFVYCNGDPVNFVDLWGLEVFYTIYRDPQSYNISTNRDSPQNVYRDVGVLYNSNTNETIVFDTVQSVANYPSTDTNNNKVPSVYNDTIASGSTFDLKIGTTTNVAAGKAAVITNATTIDGRKVNGNGITENGLSGGRGLQHSNTNPTTNVDYNTPRSKQCIIMPGEDNQKFFDVLQDWGVQDGQSIKTTIIDKEMDKGFNYDKKGNYKPGQNDAVYNNKGQKKCTK